METLRSTRAPRNINTQNPSPVILTTSQFNEIKELAVSSENPKKLQKEDPAFLAHITSRERTLKWRDNLEYLREQALEERENRLLKEELERQRIDLKEAEYQFEQRKKQIDRANNLLKAQTDRAKSLKSKIFQCEILAERELQKKELQNKKTKISDDKKSEEEREAFSLLLEREIREEKDRAKQKIELKRHLDKHLREQELKKLEEMDEDFIEGSVVKKRTEEFAKAEELERNKKIEIRNHYIKETEKCNKYLKDVKNKERIQEIEEEAKIEKISRMRDLKREEDRKKETSKAKKYVNILDTNYEKTNVPVVPSTCVHMSSDFLNSAKSLNLGGTEDITRKNIEKQKELLKQSMEDQLLYRIQKKEIEKNQDAKLEKVINSMQKKYEDKERREMAISKDNEIRLKQQQLTQVEEKKKRESDMIQKDKRTTELASKAVQQEIAEFKEQTEDLVIQYANEGKNVIPLIKELHSFHRRQKN